MGKRTYVFDAEDSVTITLRRGTANAVARACRICCSNRSAATDLLDDDPYGISRVGTAAGIIEAELKNATNPQQPTKSDEREGFTTVSLRTELVKKLGDTRNQMTWDERCELAPACRAALSEGE